MTHQHYIITETKKKQHKNILCINYITTKMTSEIINNQVNQLENEKLFKELEQKNKRYEYNRRYYLKNREKLIKKYTEYSKHYEKAHENNNLYKRLEYYIKKNILNDVNKSDAIEITKYLINNNLTIKHIEYVKYWFELVNMLIMQKCVIFFFEKY